VVQRSHHIIKYYKMRSSMPCSLMGLVVFLENIEGGRLLCGVLHAELEKPLKDKVNQASLQR